MLSAPSSEANSTHSSIALSGSGSLTSRGVSSCNAAVSTPTRMNFGSNCLIDIGNHLSRLHAAVKFCWLPDKLYPSDVAGQENYCQCFERTNQAPDASCALPR